MKYFIGFLVWAFLGLIAALVISIALPFVLEAMGFYTLEPGWSVARQIVEEGKDVRECRKIIRGAWWDWLSPPTGEQRVMCVNEYASLTKDPAACELLMPDGWKCLGVARTKGEPCSFTISRKVEWSDTPDPHDAPDEATFDECERGLVTSDTDRKCCFLLQLTKNLHVNDCSRFKGDTSFQDHERRLSLHDQCLSILAPKLRQPELCQGITDENARTICEISVKYWES